MCSRIRLWHTMPECGRLDVYKLTGQSEHIFNYRSGDHATAKPDARTEPTLDGQDDDDWLSDWPMPGPTGDRKHIESKVVSQLSQIIVACVVQLQPQPQRTALPHAAHLRLRHRRVFSELLTVDPTSWLV